MDNAAKPDRDRPAATEAAPPSSFVDRSLPFRFSLSAGTLATLAPSSGAAVAGTHASTESGTGTSGTGEVFSEKEVNVLALPISGSKPAYPPEARRAEVEADVVVQLLVDTVGRVLEAHSLTHHGYGLDEAAEQAIRTWRYSPALRAGRPVRVRMRATLQFRLR